MAMTLAMNLPAAIVRCRRAAPSVARLAGGLGLGRVAVEALVDRAEARGEVEYWPERDAVTLTPLGAERLRVRLSGSRWVRAEEPDPTERVGRVRVKTVCEADRLALDPKARMDQIPDPSPSAEAMLDHFEAREARVEALAARTGTQRRTLPPIVPRHLAGLGDQWDQSGVSHLWPNWSRALQARHAPAAACPSCLGRPLPPAGYCARCDRAGLDDRQPAEAGRKRRLRRKARPATRATPGPRLAGLVALLASG